MKLRSVLCAALILAASTTNIPASSAHAALEKTVPAKDAIVSKNTKKIALYFGEDILVLKGKNPNIISVTSAKGKSVGVGSTKVSGTQVSQSLKSPLASGIYKVSYRIVSADGHVVTGSYSFTVK